MMNYDEAIKTFHNMHPEYDTANVGTYCLHDIVLDALKTAKKEHELLGLFRHILGVEADLGYYNGIKDTMIEYSVEKPIQHILDKINELNTIYRERNNKIQELTTELESELK